jgi:hypothetical protein
MRETPIRVLALRLRIRLPLAANLADFACHHPRRYRYDFETSEMVTQGAIESHPHSQVGRLMPINSQKYSGAPGLSDRSARQRLG